MASDIVVSFLGAIQGSVSVLLTIFVGVIGTQYDLLTPEAAKRISRMCVEIFMPCLLIVNLGSELHLDMVSRYVPILVWSLFYNISTLWLGRVAVALFKLPEWTIPAVAFNNTTSLPLLLLQSLEATGVLSRLLGTDSDALDRAKSYFLVCAVVSNTLTFGKGPDVLRGASEDAPSMEYLENVRKTIEQNMGNGNANGSLRYRGSDEESRGQHEDEQQAGHRQLHAEVPHAYGSDSRLGGRADDDEEEEEGDDDQSQEGGDAGDSPDETTSLLPRTVVHWERKTAKTVNNGLHRFYDSLPSALQKAVKAMAPFLNAPFVGALIGAIIGLTPPLSRLFFNESTDGGYFNAWLTTTLENVGKLFVTLQVLVVGAKLSLSLRKMKEGKQSGRVPLGTFFFVIAVRFFLWPAISISVIWALASRTNILSSDPMLWFTMMLMPTGPSAMKLLALADVTKLDEKTRMSIAKFLTISYAITPLISLTVVGALQATSSIEK